MGDALEHLDAHPRRGAGVVLAKATRGAQLRHRAGHGPLEPEQRLGR